MKIEARDGEIILSEVYNGIGIQTDMGLFGIAQRDGGIEVLFTPPGGKTRTVFAGSHSGSGPVFEFLDDDDA